MEFDKEDIELGEVETYKELDLKFSHQVLIMSCLRKCIEAGCEEMVEGRLENKKDKSGNLIPVYKPDTRRRFIECVKTAKNFMECDFDTEAREKTRKILARLKETKREWLQKQLDWWNKLPYDVRKKNYTDKGIYVPEDCFNVKFDFYNWFIDDEIEAYRRILEELNNLSKRKRFYSTEDTET